MSVTYKQTIIVPEMNSAYHAVAYALMFEALRETAAELRAALGPAAVSSVDAHLKILLSRIQNADLSGLDYSMQAQIQRMVMEFVRGAFDAGGALFGASVRCE